MTNASGLSRTPLDEAALASRMSAELPAWRAVEVDGVLGLERHVRFRNFVEAFSFMTAVALEAQRLDHHPDWSNVYNRVQLRVSTHDAGGVTDFDFALATAVDRAAEALGGTSD